MRVLVGERDILRGEGDRLADAAHKHNAQFELIVWPRVWHSWHLFSPQLPEILTGRCFVLDLTALKGHVHAAVLEKSAVPEGTLRLLIKTGNSAHWQAGDKEFFPGFQGITEDGAEWVVEKGIRLIGIDYLSIAPYKQSVPTHSVLLKAGIIALEGVDLSLVKQGSYVCIVCR